MSVKLMLGVLRELEVTPSTLDKQALLKSAGEKIPHFKDMLRYALDPYKKYGVTAYTLTGPVGPGTVPKWPDIQDLLDKAQTRQISGTALHSAIANFLGPVGPSGRALFRRVLLKDLRCGVGGTLVNLVFPNLIPEFGIMLANPLCPHHLKAISRGAWWQAKKNGDRMIAMIPPRHGNHKAPSAGLTRKGHPLLNYQAILRSLEFVVDQSEAYRNCGVVFDGEVIKGDFFETRGAKKLAGNEVEGAVFHVFDMVSLPMWQESTSLPYRQRRVELAKISNEAAFSMAGNLTRVKSFPIDQSLLSMEYLDDLRDRQAAAGEEGLIIRLDGLYNYKSRASMMKHKKMKSMDCMIMEVLPGDEGKKHEHRAGRLLVRMDDGETLCKAGLKLTDTEREEMWAKRAELCGQMCEIAYQDKTVSKGLPPKLQFPVYVRMREDLS